MNPRTSVFLPFQITMRLIKQLIKRRYKAFKSYQQRARKGYSEDDLINLDMYLCKLVGNALIEFAQRTHSYPYGFENIEAWREFLTDNGLKLIAFRDETSLENAAFDQAREAMFQVAEYLGDLWD